MAGGAVSGDCQVFSALDLGGRLMGRIGCTTIAGERGSSENDEQRAEVGAGIAHGQPCFS
jgi:hypothetical protein